MPETFRSAVAIALSAMAHPAIGWSFFPVKLYYFLISSIFNAFRDFYVVEKYVFTVTASPNLQSQPSIRETVLDSFVLHRHMIIAGAVFLCFATPITLANI